MLISIKNPKCYKNFNKIEKRLGSKMSVFEAILCRGCALSSNENKPLFYKSSGEAVPHPTDVAEMLEEFLPFKVKIDENKYKTIL